MAYDKGRGGSAEDDSLAIIVLILATILGFAAAWYFFHDKLVILGLKYCYWIIFPFAKICSWVGFDNAFPIRWTHWIVKAATHPSDMAFQSLIMSMNKASYVLLPALYLPYRMFMQSHGHVILSLRTNHGFWSMVRAQSKSFSHTLPVIRFEDHWKKFPDQKKILRYNSLMPDDFVELHKLVSIDDGERVLNVNKTREILKDQLTQCGIEWHDEQGVIQRGIFNKEDPRCLKPHEAALFVIFATRMNNRGKASRDRAYEMLNAINQSCKPCRHPEQAFDFMQIVTGKTGGVTIEDAFKVSGVPQIIHEHRYVSTVLMRLLFEARKDGKLPCSHFIWLKIVDRHLWFALQGVTPKQIARGFCEAAGDNAQFWNEMVAVGNKASLKEAYVDNAIVALEHRLLQGYVIQRGSSLYSGNIENL